MNIFVAIIAWAIALFIGAMIGGFVAMLVIGGIFPQFGYWEWVRMAFVASSICGSAAVAAK